MIGNKKRLLIALGFPVLVGTIYLREHVLSRDTSPDVSHIAILCILVILVSGGIYAIAPTAKKIEFWSGAHILLLGLSWMVFALALVLAISIPESIFGIPTTLNGTFLFIAISIPAIHIGCRYMDVKLSFFKAPRGRPNLAKDP